MKKLLFATILAFLAIVAVSSCKKSKSDSEAYLVVETTPANKSNNLNVLGPEFPLTVEITSAMPPNGVKIQVAATTEGGGTAFYSANSNSKAPQNNYSITNTPNGTTCVVTITVTSLTNPDNSWSGTYRYSKK